MKKKWRVVLMVASVLALAGVLRATGWADAISVEAVRALMTEAGPWGVFAFLLVFAVSALVAAPGMIFILAALTAYGPLVGLPVAFIGGLLAATSAFFTARWAGGGAPRAPEGSGRLACALKGLVKHPVAVVAGLRAVFVLAGPVNLALALSPLRYRDYLVGTAVGLVPPLLVYSATLECWLS